MSYVVFQRGSEEERSEQIPANCDEVSDEDAASIVDDDCTPSHPSDGVLLLPCKQKQEEKINKISCSISFLILMNTPLNPHGCTLPSLKSGIAKALDGWKVPQLPYKLQHNQSSGGRTDGRTDGAINSPHIEIASE